MTTKNYACVHDEFFKAVYPLQLNRVASSSPSMYRVTIVFFIRRGPPRTVPPTNNVGRFLYRAVCTARAKTVSSCATFVQHTAIPCGKL